MEFSGAEWRIMLVVWRHPSVTVNDVHLALREETGWAYSTVKTMLSRLAAKGALEVAKSGKQSVFRPLVSRDSARREATSSLLDRVFEGAVGGLFQHLLGERRVSKKDREQILALLQKEENEQGKKK
ncbi:MAG: BlaI/MecI/CopY family transcriptional regulator [Bryobacterales bacterium]|nr:BlaI/MecI/CopY family transcriptional regulator [Bryobacterales bacterium]